MQGLRQSLLSLMLGATFTAVGEGRSVSAGDPSQPECAVPYAFSATVTRVIDAETVELDSGQVVRLIGSLAPRAPLTVATEDDWPQEKAAEAALRSLVLGQAVDIHAEAGAAKDRYGRLLANVYVKEDGGRIWVQGKLVSDGHARAYGLPRNFPCLSSLVKREREARYLERGLWKLSVYRVREASKTIDLRRLRSTYQVVEGVVANVARVRGATYLNFGVDWRTDFTVTVPSAAVATEFSSRETLTALEGKRIRVRGWIEQRNGPQIEVTHPDAIEILEDGSK